MSLRRVPDVREHGVEPVGSGVLVAGDVEIDKYRVVVNGDLGRPHVAHDCDLRQACDDVVDRGGERGRSCLQRTVLDQDAFARRLLEAGVEDLVHPPRLARAFCVRIDLLRTDLAADGKSDDNEGEPTEGCGLPVGGAPAAHARRQVAVLVRITRHDDSPFSR